MRPRQRWRTQQRFLAALDDRQKAQASFSFDSPERFNWHWIPRERKGLPVKAMTPEQRALAFGLLDTGLSTKGMLKATTIMSLEEILACRNGAGARSSDPELYYVSVFGNPDQNGEWGWRIEGHHLALNYTLREGKVISATPFMFGSNPATVLTGSRKACAIWPRSRSPRTSCCSRSTKNSARRQWSAKTCRTSPPRRIRRRRRQAPRWESQVDKLDDDQRKTLTQFVHAYYENFPEPIRAAFLDQLARGEQEFHFAWYGPPDPAKPHAFRLQGPTLLIDFNDKQDAANHIHTFYRSMGGDFGTSSSR